MDEAWLETVRLARDIGDISSLFPPGVTSLLDCPFTLHQAIRAALHFLEYDKIIDERDKPPKHIWLDADKMKLWWQEVKAAQEARAKGEPELRDMPQNELIAELFPGMHVG